MNRHQTDQLAYFAGIDHGERFRWQTSDPFVMAHEHATLKPLVDLLQQRLEKQGSLRVLESGSGEGVNFVHLRQLGLPTDRVQIEGIDPCAEAVDVAKLQGLNARVADGLALPYPDASFDVVFCRDVLHHLANDEERKKFLYEMARVAKPDGLVVAIEPNPGNLMVRAQSYMLWAERGLRSISPRRVVELRPGATVIALSPSAVWRVVGHYRSPLRAHPWLARPVLHVLGIWEIVCGHLPKSGWSYRIYIWNQ